MRLLKPLGVLLTCAISAGLFGGCAWSIGDGDGKPHTVSTQPTRGQELIDLKRARDQGAITPSEYETKKEQILAK
jgi:hypothetical protein